MINNQLSRSKMVWLVLALFAGLTMWWLSIHPFDQGLVTQQKHTWSSAYGVLALLGGVFGLVTAQYWGGYRSIIGRAITVFSVGLLLQFFGQCVYNYYTLFLKMETPYPSLGDLGYFGSIPAYIYGVVLLGRAAGLKFSFKSFYNQLLAVLLPLLILIVSYLFFLKGYEFDWSAPLTVLLDFGYPFGQAVYVSIALLILLVSKDLLGGMMRKSILLLLLALVIQYISDFNFLYQASHENWYAGGPGDYLYSVSYVLMTMALIHVGMTFKKINNAL